MNIQQKYNLKNGFFSDLRSCFSPISLDDFAFLKMSDDEAIQSDWETVGEDLQQALDKL